MRMDGGGVRANQDRDTNRRFLQVVAGEGRTSQCERQLPDYVVKSTHHFRMCHVVVCAMLKRAMLGQQGY